MEQLYTEAGCRPKKSGMDFLMIAAMLVVSVIGIGVVLFSGQPFLQIAGAVLIVAVIYYFPRLSYEYEYIFCDGQIDFDKIMGGNKRKTILKMDMESMEVCAPVRADEVAHYKNLKTKDFSAGQQNGETYAMIVTVNNEKIRILFDPSKKMLDFMRTKSPRKVIRY